MKLFGYHPRPEGRRGGRLDFESDNHYVILTYWRSFDAHERSHANEVIKKKFAKLATMCSETKELGYDMLWQGTAGGH